ncbi:MAG: hypothetical protein LBC20_07080 [Planctomycetaceae bacterium]|jgi:hypothetical protein|nr:hypothetical protein [Planctomycetaceae bacterium]
MAQSSQKSVRIIISKQAQKQWNKILEFYSKRNQSAEYSIKPDERLCELLDLLYGENFVSGELTNRKGIRRIGFENRFAVFFRMKQDCIEVTSIVDTRRNIQLS